MRSHRHDSGHIQTLASKLQDLNDRVSAVRREQQYQREIESTFRDASERVNGRAVWWSVWQILVLIGVAVAEMRYLKVSCSVTLRSRLSFDMILIVARILHRRSITLRTRSCGDASHAACCTDDESNMPSCCTTIQGSNLYLIRRQSTVGGLARPSIVSSQQIPQRGPDARTLPPPVVSAHFLAGWLKLEFERNLGYRLE